MNDIIGRLFVFLFGTIFLFMVPLMLVNLKVDQVRQVEIDDAVVEFVDNAKASGKITHIEYTRLVSRIVAAFPKCDVKITYEQSVITPNKTATGYVPKRTLYSYNRESITNFMYYETDEYGNLINDASGHPINRSQPREFPLRAGGYLTVTVTSRDVTPGTAMVRMFIPRYTGSGLYTSYSGYVGNDYQKH